MKKYIAFTLILMFILLSAEEIYINKEGVFYKVVLDDETGDTLSVEEIQIINMTPEPEEKIEEEPVVMTGEHVYVDDPQFLEKYIPYKWQIGTFGLLQGWAYGAAIAQGLYMPGPVIAGSGFIMPIIMFLTPPLIMSDSIDPISIPIVDWGYRLGFADYFAARYAVSENNFMSEQAEWLAPVALGLIESWGGHYLLKGKGYRRAAGHFYAAGSMLGYTWGGMLGAYAALKTNVSESTTMRTAVTSGFVTSLALRTAGFMFGNNKNMGYRSFDAWIIAVNTIPGMLVGMEYYIHKDAMIDEFALTTALCGIASSAATGYILRDTHFDDGNAVMLLVGGAMGAAFGIGLNISMQNVINNFYPSLVAAGMVAGEFAVYALRKNTIGFDMNVPENIGMSIMPDFEKNGVNVGLNIRF